MATVTIPLPFGQLINKSTASLSSPTLLNGGSMNSTCSGIPGALCAITLSGPDGQSISLGQKVLDNYGGAEFTWNVAELGLTVGQWTVTATTTYAGQVKINSVVLTVSP